MNSSTDPSAASHPPATDRRHSAALYIVPLFVVVLLVFTWLVFSWSLPQDDDPQRLVRDLRGPGRGSWQTAYALAELLRNPRNDALRQDVALCRELASFLEEQLGQTAADAEQLRFRVFLCRALGAFEVPDGLPTLVRAAEVSQTEGQGDVQCAALEAIAVLAGRLGPLAVRVDPRVMTVLSDASRAGDNAEAAGSADRVAATAAFALGLVGGDAAVERLRQLLRDPRSDVRYNAATGLARQGDPAAVPVLLEMLSTDNSESLTGGRDAAAQARRHALVLSNAIRAVRLIAPSVTVDRQPLLQALQAPHDAPDLPPRLRSDIQAAQAALQARQQPPEGFGGL